MEHLFTVWQAYFFRSIANNVKYMEITCEVDIAVGCVLAHICKILGIYANTA